MGWLVFRLQVHPNAERDGEGVGRGINMRQKDKISMWVKELGRLRYRCQALCRSGHLTCYCGFNHYRWLVNVLHWNADNSKSHNNYAMSQRTALQGRHFCRSNWNLENLDFRRVVEADSVDTIMLTSWIILFKHRFSNREREFNLFYFID